MVSTADSTSAAATTAVAVSDGVVDIRETFSIPVEKVHQRRLRDMLVIRQRMHGRGSAKIVSPIRLSLVFTPGVETAAYVGVLPEDSASVHVPTTADQVLACGVSLSSTSFQQQSGQAGSCVLPLPASVVNVFMGPESINLIGKPPHLYFYGCCSASSVSAPKVWRLQISYQVQLDGYGYISPFGDLSIKATTTDVVPTP